MHLRRFPVIDPTRPMLSLVREFRMKLVSREQGLSPEFEMDGVLAELFFMFQRQNSERDATIDVRLDRFCRHLEALGDDGVEARDLASAPKLTRWRVLILDGAPVLVGALTGHPRLGDSNRMHTSPLFRLEPAAGWARTWSRVYALGERDETALDPLKPKLH